MLTLNRIDFVQALEAVKIGLGFTKERRYDQSTCFLFQGGKVHTYNDEIFCRAPSGLPKEYQAAVPSKQLLELLRSRTDKQELGIELEGSHLKLKLGSGAKVRLVQAAEINLDLTRIDRVAKWDRLPDGFIEAVGLVSFCTQEKAQNQMAFMTCVHVTPDFVEGFDNSQACRAWVKTGATQNYQLRNTAIKVMEQTGISHHAETNNWLQFANASGLIIGFKKFVDPFPQIDQLLEVQGKPAHLPKLLMQFAKEAAVFTQENKDDNEIIIDIQPRDDKNSLVRVLGIGVTGDYENGRIMPYSNGRIRFKIHPQMLERVLTQFDKFQISKRALIVEGDNWKYVARIDSEELS